MANPTRSILALLMGLLLPACSQTEVFSKFQSLPETRWDKQEAIRFEAPIRDISVPYRVMIELRNNDHYPYRNIWLFVDYQTPGGSVRTDTLCTDLADAYGKWYGKGISLYSYSFPYQLHVQYPDTGTYTYTIRQGMRADVLNGIADVGLRIFPE
ncbi:MAG: gliding motility lipoprotein GldH [Dysgonamonadaceae bacterium]|jgi:gliding motility-associated lipoprotein GldH|nr:gliding motility lipoprotein GldH [Dysgonamonadaceae bacterium]